MSIIILSKFRTGLYILIVLIPLESQRIILPYASKENFKDIITIPYLFPAIIISCMSYVLFRFTVVEQTKGEKLVGSAINFIILLLVIWSFITLFWAPNFYKSLLYESRFLSNIALFYLIVTVINHNHKELYLKLLNVHIVTGIVLSIAGIVSLFMTFKPYSYTFEATNFLWLNFSFFTYPHRLMGLSFHNVISQLSNILIAITFGLILISKEKKYYYGMVLFLFVITQLLTRSRGGLVGFIVMVAFFFVSIRSLREKFFRNVIFFFIIFVFLFISVNLDDFIYGTARYSTELADKSISQRIGWWKDALQMLLKKTAGFGLSPGGFTHYFGSWKIPHAHNIYLSVLFDFGIVGFILWISFLWVLIKKVYHIMIMQVQSPYKTMLCSVTGGVIATGIHGLIDMEYNIASIWFALGILIATLNLAKKELATLNPGVFNS